MKCSFNGRANALPGLAGLAGLALTLAVGASLLSGCAGQAGARREANHGDGSSRTNEPFTFVSTAGASHPLVGVFYDPLAKRTVTREEVLRRLLAARFVFLGESHDNLDHHRFEAAAVAHVASGRAAAVVMEMIARDKQTALDRLETAPQTSANDDENAYEYQFHDDPLDGSRRRAVTAIDIASAVGWKTSGWPAFSAYEPVFDAILANDVRLYGGDLPAASAHAIAHNGAAAIDPALVTNFHLSTPVPADQEVTLEKEIADVHCGMLPPEFVPKMVLAQRARDATLAETILEANRRPGRGNANANANANAKPVEAVVLVSGAGHARTDRAVPKLLRDHGIAAASMLSIGMVEVDDERKVATDYAAEFSAPVLPFDIVWFTPRASDDDPCEKMKAPSK